MKKTLFVIIAGILFISLTGCMENGGKRNAESVNDTLEGEEGRKPSETVLPAGGEDDVINIWSLTGEFTMIINKFIETHPDFEYEIHIADFSNVEAGYEPVLYDTLVQGEAVIPGFDTPDIYPVEMSYAMRYAKGDAYQFAADYKELGIDADILIEEASIPQYYIDVGTNPEGKLVGLGYHNTAGAFIYRRSIAKEVWKTDDPSIIKDIVGPGWDRFFEAAAELRKKGYGICSGIEDMWLAVKNSTDLGWVVDGKLYIDPRREVFLDDAMKLIDNDYTNNTRQWSDEWYSDMKDEGEKKIFGFLGPAWLSNYVIMNYNGGETVGEGTYGDWAICNPPAGFFWGGTMVFAHRDSKHKEAIGEIIRWITLDTSETGCQYLWADGAFSSGVKEIPASATVTKNLDGSLDFLGGQDIFEAYRAAGNLAGGYKLVQDDEAIDMFWRSEVYEYVSKSKSREQAIADFKQRVADYTDVMVE